MKIPEQAKRVFKGVIFDVYQWEQERFDGTKSTWECLKRRDSVQILATKGDKVLAVEEEQPGRPPFKGLLGGFVEDGETPLETAKKELREEAGMQSDDIELLWTFEPSQKMDWTVHVFAARNCEKVQEQELEPGERITVKVLTLEEFYAHLADPTFRAKDIASDILLKRYAGDGAAFEKKLFSDA